LQASTDGLKWIRTECGFTQGISINMGGSRSGRYGWRGVMEHRRQLNVRDLTKCTELGPGWIGPIHWGTDDNPGGSATILGIEGGIELRHNIVHDDETRTQVSERIQFRCRPCRYGGDRRYWACPRCWRTCEAVVMASNASFWGCRKCLRLLYVSQGLVPRERLWRRAEQIRNRLGGTDDDGYVWKPKWMRRRTFDRLCAKANALEEEGDLYWIWSLRRLGIPSLEAAYRAILGESAP